MQQHPMRLSKNEIADMIQIEKFLAGANVCHLGMSDKGQPYVVPMNYGYSDGQFYLHCAAAGRKLDILRENNLVCVEVTVDAHVISEGSPCSWSTAYTSVIGFGRAFLIEAAAEKEAALNKLMHSYTGSSQHEFNAQSMNRVTVIRIEIDDIRAKQNI